MPHLFATPQQVQRGNTYQVPAAVLGEQSALDLVDLGTHGTAKRDPACIVDVQSHNGADFRHRASSGLQCIATHQSRCDYDTR